MVIAMAIFPYIANGQLKLKEIKLEKQKNSQVISRKNISIEKIKTPRFSVDYNINLSVCQQGNDCLKHGMSFSKGQVHFATGKLNSVLEFIWDADVPKLDGIIWQVSKYRFDKSNVQDNPQGLVRTGTENRYYKDGDLFKGNFYIEFADFTKPQIGLAEPSVTLKKKISKKEKGELKKKQKIKSSFNQTIVPVISYYFVRILPVVNGHIEYNASNVIALRFSDLPKDSNFEYYNPPKRDFSDIYDVKLIDFTPIKPPTVPWGSVRVIGFDENLYRQHEKLLGVKQQRDFYEEKLKKNELIIPETYKGEGSDNWVESLWGAATSAADWVSNAYEWPKDQFVKHVAGLINTIPGVNCDADCKKMLKAGLETGLVAVGVPPSLPNADELLDEGIEYLAAEVSSQVGCVDLCTDMIKSQIEELGKELSVLHRATVNNAEEAHRNGREPLSIPDWVNVKIVAESAIQPAKLVLQLSRNNIDVSDEETLDHYYIRISFSCTNNSYKSGQTISVPVYTVYKEGLPTNYRHAKLTLKKEPMAPLWGSKLIAIPKLDKGETIRFSIFPEPGFGYLFPGHLKLIRDRGGHIFHDDWMEMYMDGNLKISAEIVGEQEVNLQDPWTTPADQYTILRTISKDFHLPNEFPGEMRLRRRIQ